MSNATTARVTRPIRSLLVANRGEIALRIFETAHRLGMSTVAVFADSDRRAPHVLAATQAVSLNGTTAAETYLDIDKVLAAAARTGADAVHPGYGFLAESAAFAQAVIDAGLTWVGPPPDAIATMGNKVVAKARVAEAGVPLLPSANVDGDDPAGWAAAAERVGFPLLVKAAAGGGGKGMTLVASAHDVAGAITSARRTAASAFGDDTVFLERYLERPRHVEVQVFGDADGVVVHYGTRDCSVQRRQQKVVEEAPAPGLTPELRDRLHTSAVAAARRVDYRGAGTVEFLVAGDECFFLEMNTRLQVEHRVTEQIYGVDLVELQLRVAGGEVLGLDQQTIAAEGHAIEVRIYAEDPANDFLPSVGTIERFDLAPADRAEVLCDSGVHGRYEVSPHFDPMLAKLVFHASHRATAAGRLAKALRAMRLHGLVTNRDSLVAVLEHDAFVAGEVHTAFFDDHPATRTARPPDDVVRRHAVGAALALRARRDAAAEALGVPKVARAGWRNVGSAQGNQTFSVGGSPDQRVEVAYGPPPRSGSRMPVEVRGPAPASTPPKPVEPWIADGVDVATDHVEVDVDGLRLCVDVDVVGDLDDPDGCRVWVNDQRWQTALRTVPRFAGRGADTTAQGPSAPVPGTVVAVEVAEGDEVHEGQALVVVEAMKMEHRLTADAAGTVVEVRVEPGDKVDAHQVLVVVEPA